MRRTAEDTAVTRAALLDAALTVVARRGYAAARLEEVAAQAGVTRGALYHHFASKAALYNEAVAARWGEVAHSVFGALDDAGTPRDRTHRFVRSYVDRLAIDPRFRQLLDVVVLRTEPHPDLQGGLADKRDALAGWAEALLPVLGTAEHLGDLRDGLDARGAVADILTVLFGVTVVQAFVDPADRAPASAVGVDAARVAETVCRGLFR